MPRDVQEPVPGKFVIRKLPPELTEDAFGATLRNLCKEELDWFRYHPGSTGDSGISTSTAFIKLKHSELAPVLKQILQNSPFIGDHGVPYHCEMEVAVYQRIPKDRAKEDPYVATYEQDPYYKDFMSQMAKEDEAAKKGPTITATTTIAEDTSEQEPIVTPLMSYIINRYRSNSGRTRNGKGSSGDGREKENRKKLQAIPQKAGGGKATTAETPATGKAAPGKKGRGSKKDEKVAKGKANSSDAPAIAVDKQQESQSGPSGKGGRGKGTKGVAKTASSAGARPGSVNVPAATTAADGAPVVISTADVAAARSAAQAAARVAMQLASDKDKGHAVAASDGAAKNGSAPISAKGLPKRPKTSRRARGRGGGAQDGDGAGAEGQGQPQGGEAPASLASDRAIAAAAAAATAALQDSAPGERPRPRTRPALGARGVRDALSRAGIKQPGGRNGGGSRKEKVAGSNGGAAATSAGDGRDGNGAL
eukprot:jgi/Ulvmu1/3950/UM018_0173.1